MIAALALAVAATTLAAAGLVELAAAGVPRRRRRRASATGAARMSGALAGLGRRLGAPAAPGDLARRLEAAGAPAALSVGDVMAVKGGAAAVAFVAGLAPGALLPGRLGPLLLVAAPAAAFAAPDAWLARRTRHRRAMMAIELADVLDLLHVAVAAGMPAMRAIGEVGRRRGGPLAAELRAAAMRAQLGVPRAEVLDGLVRRCPLEGVAALAAAVGRAERHGAPLAPTLRALVADARADRAQRLRERAARAAPKIQLVVALLLVPAVMFLVGACLAAGFL